MYNEEDLFDSCLESIIEDNYCTEGFKDTLKKAGTAVADAAKNAGNTIIKIINAIINTIRKCINSIANSFRKLKGKEIKEFEKKDTIKGRFKTSTFKKKEAEARETTLKEHEARLKEHEEKRQKHKGDIKDTIRVTQYLIDSYDLKDISLIHLACINLTDSMMAVKRAISRRDFDLIKEITDDIDLPVDSDDGDGTSYKLNPMENRSFASCIIKIKDGYYEKLLKRMIEKLEDIQNTGATRDMLGDHVKIVCTFLNKAQNVVNRITQDMNKEAEKLSKVIADEL